ncbi:MAG: recombinase family protein, partial [Methylobacterium sp.]|uniref:recombinase family protein n=1 Tax=Methylobacterium sp. TaxID=409 RepID=UPI00258A7823
KLVVDEAEAEQVRALFRGYLEQGCLSALIADLRSRGVVTRAARLKDGRVRGRVAFGKGALGYLLRNRIYVGEVEHKGRHYPGEHAGIVPRELFEAVQARLSAQAQERVASRVSTGGLLRGLVYDAQGRRMVTSTAKKGAVRYRYYVSAGETGPGASAGKVVRVPAPEVEQAVLEALGLGDEPVADAAVVAARVRRVVVRADGLELHLMGREESGEAAPLVVPWVRQPRRRRRGVIRAAGEGRAVLTDKGRARLVERIATARVWLDDLVSGRVADTQALAAEEGCSERAVRQLLNLAFLSPALMRAAVSGEVPEGSGVTALTHAPLSWREQSSSAHLHALE